VSNRLWILAVAVAVPFGAHDAGAADKTKKKDVLSFGALRAPDGDAARGQALDWLKQSGKADAAALKGFDGIWTQLERPLLDRVADSLVLAEPEAARALAEVRDLSKPAPLTVPAFFTDTKRDAFFRSNVALAYAKALSQRRAYEEALEVLRTIKPEQVVDPAGYLFNRAVAEHALSLKNDASRSISRLLDDAADSPERYKMVATLMALDIQGWKDKDLGAIARKMDNVDRRLQLARGGPHTQKIQKEIVSRLDELIKQLENQAKGSSQANAGACPNGGQQQPGQRPGAQGPTPQLDSFGGNNSGPGNVDKKKLDGLAQQWGKLPEKERAKAMQELTRDLPPEYRELIEAYFRKLAQLDSKP
jgi:hypothetical protein